MVVLLFRLLILIAFILVVYTIIQYFRNPGRKLQIAKAANTFYMVDDQGNSKKNIQFVYKGCLFEGEKYIGATEEAFEVVDIHIFARDTDELEGITRDDLYFIEKELLMRYPYAAITWKYPINKLVLTTIE
ncbi:sigma-w pathway protein ysdB [Lentibacillus amyloliquefaciens]|uniref:Sigma-w pathway protein ysdB n=1 Tax=Lentibacillus amyloliquefaciens TaxID=1472767 RepID=A0A0U3WEU8_9BACI|nr:sigma-w pathway protein ysdB [Lentibacillus amyloliquefaciens]ALX48319.1 sigma-w pathway protein ysdB [Lentibacillus amyloliquefaciens]